MSFIFKNISYIVNAGKENEKQIINDVSGKCHSGEMLGILGPSGSGKTSLLNVLTLNAIGGDSTGLCHLNDEQMSSKVFKDHCCIVPQEDHHRAFLTCKATLRYTANFYMDSSDEEKEAEVNSILNKLGLEGCANTLVGNAFMPGLSGGQKKRLSIGIALLKKPSLMLLDEPTSGLDAAASFHVMKYIKNLAIEYNIIVVCTIHQPSSPIYNSFSRVLLLSGGRCAFEGSPERSTNYFAEQGHEIPMHTNPAEFLLDVINSEFTDPASVEKILKAWTANSDNESLNSPSKESAVKRLIHSDSKLVNLSLWKELHFVTARQLHIVATDPMIYLGRAIMFLFACAFFAVVYVKARDRKQEQVLNRLWICMWFIGVPSSLGVVAVYAYNEEFKTLKKEVKNGMYSIWAYLISSFLIQIPAMFILAIFAIAVPGFGIISYYPPNFFMIIVLYALVYFSYESIARALSVASDNPLIGMLNFLQLWFTSFLFAGVLIPEDQVIWPLRVFCYILPLKWGIAAVAKLDTYDETYSGAHECTVGDQSVVCLTHDASSGKGWYCDSGIDISQCYGYEGKDVLDSLGGNYEAISSDVNVYVNFGIILGIAFSFHILYMLLAWMNVMKVSKIVEKGDSKSMVKPVQVSMVETTSTSSAPGDMA